MCVNLGTWVIGLTKLCSQKIINEQTGSVNFGVVLYRARSGPIDPQDYSTFEAFHKAVEQAWQDTWHRAYELKATFEHGSGDASTQPTSSILMQSSGQLW